MSTLEVQPPVPSQWSLALQGLPSSHSVMVGEKAKPQAPLLGSQTFCWHSLFKTDGHCTTVLGLSWHLPAALLQNNLPLQALPSSYGAQSASWLQAQVMVPEVQVPARHTSPTVQALPSSHGVRSAASTTAQVPLCG
jgi:hypothetical protein